MDKAKVCPMTDAQYPNVQYPISCTAASNISSRQFPFSSTHKQFPLASCRALTCKSYYMSNIRNMKKIILSISIICASGLVMVSIYNSIIDARSWSADIPATVQVARDYYTHVDPRNFYALIVPINQASILLALILFWGDSAL